MDVAATLGGDVETSDKGELQKEGKKSGLLGVDRAGGLTML